MTTRSHYDLSPARLLSYGFALVVPPLFAYNLTPSPTLLNELLATFGWGVCLLLASLRPTGPRFAVGVLLAALGVLAIAVVVSWKFGSLPTSLSLPPLILLLVGCAVAMLGASAAREGDADGTRAFEPFAIGMVATGVLSAFVAMVQVFWPGLADGDLIARSGLPGRAIGNLRQPNHLASLLIWSLITLVPLVEWRRIPRWLGGIVGTFILLGVILSGSRTGLYGGVAVLSFWGAGDIRMSGRTRLMLGATVPVSVLLWMGLAYYLASRHHVFGAQERLAEGDSSHFAIWKNAFEMLRQQPWFGVGWGEFNFAWTLTPFPGRPTAFFDHSHDLPLQLAVEIGLPGAILVLGLLLFSLGQGAWRAWTTDGDAGHGARAAWVMIAMIALHSLDEYPLWYAYFLLPAAWAWGFTLGSGRAIQADDARAAAADPAVDQRDSTSGLALRFVGGAMVVLSLYAGFDYWRVSTIFLDEEGMNPLAERIATGQRSLLFAHHADYAAATTQESSDATFKAIRRASHSLLDTRLMIAWANALDQRGESAKARYVVARLREFRNKDADEFFAPCADAASVEKPFQCQPETPGLTWRDLR